MVFKTSLVIIYSGYFWPYILPFINTLDFVNEVLTLLCTYSLCMFSAFVPEARTRYLCGWQLIGLVSLMIALNLIIIIFTSIRSSINRCKLKCIRRRNLKQAR